MGKTRIIAETGAGQHGVATAMACAKLNMPCVVYMGAVDVARQAPNVERMKLLECTSYCSIRRQDIKRCHQQALRDWIASCETTHYVIGTAAGPHPFPTMVRFFKKLSGVKRGRNVWKR